MQSRENSFNVGIRRVTEVVNGATKVEDHGS